MARVVLSIEAHLCGPVSVGTVQVIRALHECLELPLTDAVAYVNRCVFDAECVVIPAPSLASTWAVFLGQLRGRSHFSQGHPGRSTLIKSKRRFHSTAGVRWPRQNF
jgi:hypothetical protein